MEEARSASEKMRCMSSRRSGPPRSHGRHGELHGLGVSRRIAHITQGTFNVQPGSLFPALHRLEEAGWLTSIWKPSENNRRAKYYRLTKAGHRQLDEETAQWNRVALAIAMALEA